ncbi:MAG: hypothetical protein WHS64_03135 [Fervidobacterium sp.]|uniref:hypothetical protein n=1 Tax=Fervidobacterium TaxID=2422 RepID=UPI0030B61026
MKRRVIVVKSEGQLKILPEVNSLLILSSTKPLYDIFEDCAQEIIKKTAYDLIPANRLLTTMVLLREWRGKIVSINFSNGMASVPYWSHAF